MMKIAIVIPTFNRAQILKRTLDDLFSQKNRISSFIIDILVVIDGCTDNTESMLIQEYPDVKRLNTSGDFYYTKSMNVGFNYAIEYKYNYVLTMNDDIILGKNYLEKILTNLGETIVGSISLADEQNPKIFFSGVKAINQFTGSNKKYHNFLQKVTLDDLTGRHLSMILPGRGMLIPIEILSRNMGFDEKFKQYYSDGDFCLRAIKLGYKVVVDWEAIIYVRMQMTSRSSSFVKKDFVTFFKEYFNPVSRIYIPQKLLFNFRHGPLLTFMPRFLFSLIMPLINQLNLNEK